MDFILLHFLSTRDKVNTAQSNIAVKEYLGDDIRKLNKDYDFVIYSWKKEEISTPTTSTTSTSCRILSKNILSFEILKNMLI